MIGDGAITGGMAYEAMNNANYLEVSRVRARARARFGVGVGVGVSMAYVATWRIRLRE